MSTNNNRRDFIRMQHKIDIYSKSTVANDMGQHKATWTLKKTGQRIGYTPATRSTAIRIAPSIEQADFYTFYFPHNVGLNYNCRLKNLRSFIKNEVVDPGWFEIIQISQAISFSGRIMYLQVTAKNVVE